MSPTVFLGVIVFTIGLIIGTLLLQVTRTVRILRKRGVPVEGRVISVRRVVGAESGSHMHSTVEYQDTFGTVHTTSWGYEIPTDTIELLMDPQKPSRVTPAVADPHSVTNRLTEVLVWMLIIVSYGAAAMGVVLMLRIIDLD